MKSCERVIAALNLERPDRAPVMHSPLPGALIKYGETLNAIYAEYPQDFGLSKFDIPKPENLPPDYRKGIHKDECMHACQSIWIYIGYLMTVCGSQVSTRPAHVRGLYRLSFALDMFGLKVLIEFLGFQFHAIKAA